MYILYESQLKGGLNSHGYTCRSIATPRFNNHFHVAVSHRRYRCPVKATAAYIRVGS